MRKHHFKLMVTSLQTKNSIYDIDFNKKIIVIGNEANGVSKEFKIWQMKKQKFQCWVELRALMHLLQHVLLCMNM